MSPYYVTLKTRVVHRRRPETTGIRGLQFRLYPGRSGRAERRNEPARATVPDDEHRGRAQRRATGFRRVPVGGPGRRGRYHIEEGKSGLRRGSSPAPAAARQPTADRGRTDGRVRGRSRVGL